MVKTGRQALIWPRNGSVEATFDAASKAPCKVKGIGPGETLAPTADALWTVPEGSQPSLWRTTRTS